MNERHFAGCEWRVFILRVDVFAQGRVLIGFEFGEASTKETVKA
jgi:hypothetical protein